MKNDVTSIPDHKHQTRQLVIIKSDDSHNLYYCSVFRSYSHESCPFISDELYDLYHCLCSGNTFCCFLCDSLSHTRGSRSPCLLLIQRGIRQAGRTDRRISYWLYLSRFDPGPFYQTFFGKYICRYPGNDPRNDCMLYLRNGMAGLAAGAELYRIPGDWCASLFAG